MNGSHTFTRLVSCMLLLLLLLLLKSTSAGREPSQDLGGPPAVGDVDWDRASLMEAVKTGILRSLGMDREPRPAGTASQRELRRVSRLYWETLRDMQQKSSRPETGTGGSTLATVLFPVETLRPLQSHGAPQWHRVVFRKSPEIQNLPGAAEAKLRISRLILGAAQRNREIEVRLPGMKAVSSAAWKNSTGTGSGSGFQAVTLDIAPAVQTWMRTTDPWLSVDIGLGNDEALRTNWTVSMELSFLRAPQKKNRLRRSNTEDECDDRGWCCRKSVTVSFKDIGWSDWVFAPEQYTMHFCDGTCPHNYKPASMHTQVKSRLHRITKGATPRPCCVPAAYEPMVLMHYDSQGKLKLTPFKDFIVSKCHCA